ncbi:MAG: choice-of-anchor D domain-containing protein [Bacteroidetes bacterium]|nr:choice-of-anchor D domain-containing protein [Bacteroidota bacterium]
MRTVFRSTAFLLISLLFSSLTFAQPNWQQQPTVLQSNPTTFVQVGGLWGLVMTDTGTGFAAGYASVSNGFSGVLRKLPGNPTWFVLPASIFTLLPASHSLWSGISAVGTHVWVCGSNGRLYKSTDNGNSWNAAMNGMTGTNTLFDVFFKSQNEGMAVGNNGTIYYTSDGGANWTAQTLPATVPTTATLYVAHSAGSNWYVAGANNTLMRGTPATSSTGWVDLTGNVPALGDIEGLQFLDNLTGTISNAVTGGSPLYRTTDGGNSFTAIGSGLTGADYKTIDFLSANHGWTGNGYTPLSETTNGGQTWTARSTTTLPSQNPAGWLTRIDFPSNTIGYACGGAPGTSSTGWILRYEAPAVPDISTTPTALDFGTVECDTTKTVQFTIENTGLAPLTIQSITFSTTEFVLVGPLPTPIPSSGGATINVRWTPAQSGAIPPNTTMTIASNDPANPAWNVDLSGLYNTGTFAIGNSYTFPDACAGDSSDVVINVTTTGNLTPKLIAFMHISGHDDVILASPAPGSSISGSTQLIFRFKPSAGGARSGVYRLTYGNPACPKHTDITFDGMAYETDLTLSPAVVDFGDVCTGENKTLEVTVTNNGTTNAVISLRQFAGGKDAFPNMHATPFGPIPPGQSRQYSVRFAPGDNDTGHIEGIYKLIVDPCKDTLLLVLRGRGVRPAVTFIPTTVLAIGPTSTGNVVTEPVQINNVGNTDVTVTRITLNPPNPRLTLVNLPTLPLVLPRGQSTSVSVRFSPDRTENITASLCVHWSDPCADSSCLSVGATSGESPTIVVDTVHDVGVQRCATAHADTLWVYNTGKGTLTLKRFTLGGNDPGHFRILAPQTPRTVHTGDSAAVVLSYLAPANGVSNASLAIEHDDPKPGFLTTVKLRGERRTVQVAIEGDTTSPYVSCAHVGRSRTLSIRNRETEDLLIHGITVVSGGNVFHVASTPLPATVPGGSALSFEINFTPITKGVFTGMVEISYGPCPDTLYIELTGEGNITELSFSPDPLDFGAVIIGNPSTRTLRVNNTGSEALLITGAALQAGGMEFSIVSPPTFPVTVAVGQWQEFTLRFDPVSVQTVSSRFCVSVSAPCPDTLCVDIRGRGSSTGVGLTRTRMEFQLDPCTQEETCDNVDIVNSAGQQVEIRGVRIEPPEGFRIEMARTPPFTLANTASETIRICASGNFTGSRSANLVVESSDPNTPLLRMPVTARRDSSGFLLAETEIDFGPIADCQIGISRLVTVTNTGTLPEFIDTLRGTEAFLVSTNLPVAIQPSGLTQVRITFDPPRHGIFVDTLFFSSARCGKRVPMIVRGAWYEPNYTITPQPLVFSDVAVGSDETRNLVLDNLHLSSVRIADVRILPAGTAFASWGAYPKTVAAGNTTDLPILFNPQSPGAHDATACIVIDQPCPDTICVDLQGRTAEALITAEPAMIDFGAVAQCAERRDTVLVRNNGNEAIALTDARLSGPDAALFRLVSPLGIPISLQPQAIHSFIVETIVVATPVDGPKQAELVVTTDNSAQAEVRVPVTMKRVTLMLPPDMTVDFGPVLVGGQYTRTVTLSNPGSMRIDVVRAVLPPGIDIDPPLPISIDPGADMQLEIRFSPGMPGTYNEALILRHDFQCSEEMTIVVLADVRESVGARPLDFGVVPDCRSSRSTTALHNSLDMDVTLSAARIEGADAAFLRIVSPDVFPVIIASGDSILVDVELTPAVPSERTYSADVVFTMPVGEETREVRIPVSADVTGIFLTSSPMDFGDVTIGTTASRTVILRNDNPFSVRVTDAQAMGAMFRITGVQPAPPVVIPPDGSLEVTVEFGPETVALFEEELSLLYSDPCTQTDAIPLHGNGIDDRLRAGLRIEAHEGSIDDVIDIPLLLTQDLDGAGVESWEGAIRFNPTMLYPLEILQEGTLSAGMSVAMQYDGGDGLLSLSAAGAPLQSGIGALAILRMQVLIGDALRTPLAIEPDFTFTSGRAVVENRSDGAFTLIDYCDADGVRLVRQKAAATLTAYRPNPFREHAVIEYALSAEGRVSVVVYDHLGRETAMLVDGFRTAGSHRIDLDGSGLAPGVYFLVLQSPGSTIVQKIVRMH